MDFTKLTNEERENMFVNEVDTTFEIHRDILSFERIEEDIPSIKVGSVFEIPPLNLEEIYPSIVTLTSTDNKGKWTRVMTRTYIIGGKVLYKKIDENYFEVSIKF